MTKEDYQNYKDNHVCPQCGMRKAAPGKVRCEICLAQNAKSAQRKRDSRTESEKEALNMRRRTYFNNLKENRRINGLCIWCGKPVSKSSKCFCIDCKIKNQRRNEARKSGVPRSERHLYGICYRCGKNHVIDGKKLCQSCYEKNINSLVYANESRGMKKQRLYIKQQNNLIFGR